MGKIEIKLDMKTPTVNHLYGQRPGGFGKARYLKPEAKKLKKEIKEIVDAYVMNQFKETKGGYEIHAPWLNSNLRVIVEIHEDWFTKRGEVKRKDIANREKFLIDSVFDALGVDDKFIFEHNMKKCQDSREFAIIKIEALE